MLKKFADHYVNIGKDIAFCRYVYAAARDAPDGLSKEQKAQVQERLKRLKVACFEPEMTIAGSMLLKRVHKIPDTLREFDTVVEAIDSELGVRQLLYVAPNKVPFLHDDAVMASPIRKRFPNAFSEMKIASSCYALGLNTACVLHSMRAAEIGLWSLGRELGVSFPDHPIELAQWHNIIEQIECKVKEIKKQKKSTEKDDNLHFYAQLASDFHYFKDGWRVRAAHARASFDDAQALKILSRTQDFFDVLATRLKEGNAA